MQARLSPAERAELDRKAMIAGVKTSEAVRQAIAAWTPVSNPPLPG